MTQTVVPPATHLHRLLDDLVDRVPSAELAMLLAVDGLPIVTSKAVTEETGDFVAAAAAALHALAVAAGQQLDGGTALRTIVEMEYVLLVVEPAGDNALLAVAFGGAPDPETVNGPVTEAAERAGRSLGADGQTLGGTR